MREMIGQILGYVLIGAVAFISLWATIGFICWQWQIVLWPDWLRGVLAVGTISLIILWLTTPWSRRQ